MKVRDTYPLQWWTDNITLMNHLIKQVPKKDHKMTHDK